MPDPTFDCDSWVLITDTSDSAAMDLTNQQSRILHEKGCDNIQTVDCAAETAPAAICGLNGIAAFPTMCSKVSHKCISGLNETDSHFADLQVTSES